jgi:hypothetical protein
MAGNLENSSIRFGTSSFSSSDWMGPFYPDGTKPSDFLGYYAKQFDTVEVDATYYSLPTERMVDRWRAVTPGGFLIAAKFPRAIVHAGEKAKPDSGKLLMPEHTYEIRDRFLAVMSRLGDRLGPLLIQFPYFSAGWPRPWSRETRSGFETGTKVPATQCYPVGGTPKLRLGGVSAPRQARGHGHAAACPYAW